MKKFISLHSGSIVLLPLFWLALSMPAYATNTPGMRASFNACIDRSGGVTSSMNDCIGIELDYQNSRLKRIYKRLMAAFDKAGQEQMRQAEQAWNAMMKAYCDPGPEPGTGQSLDAYGCTLNETAKRASMLEYMNQHKSNV